MIWAFGLLMLGLVAGIYAALRQTNTLLEQIRDALRDRSSGP